MAEPISDQRVEEIFDLADEIIRAPSRFTKDFVVQELGRGVAELAGATERARAELAEVREQLGKTQVEWRAEQPSGAWNPSHNLPTEQVARTVVKAERALGYPTELKQRVVGEWKAAEQQPEDVAAVPTAQPRCGAMASRVDFGGSAAPCALPGGHDSDHATADGTVRWGRRSKGGDRG